MSKTRNAVQEMIDSSFQSRSQISAAMMTMGLEPRVLQRVAPLDDGVDPAAPMNVEVSEYIGAVGVEWDAPPQSDAVESVEIEVTPTTGAQFFRTINDAALSYTFSSLAMEQHTFRVRFHDKFDRTSDWSASVTGEPSQSAQYEIDFQKAEMLGTLKGLLPNENLATIEDATKLGEGVVLAEALAVQDAAAMNLWVGNAAIERAMLADAIIDTAKIDDLMVTTAKMADLSVTNAKISTLEASKITTSTLTATTITLGTGGVVQSAGGGMILSDAGLQLTPETILGTPSENIDRKVTAWGGKSSLSFYNQSAPNTRGVFLRADGVTGGPKVGGLFFMTTPQGSVLDSATSTVDINSIGTGNIILNAGRSNGTIGLQSQTTIDLDKGFKIGVGWSGLSINGNGSWIDFTHNVGTQPDWIVFQWKPAGVGAWRPLSEGPNSPITCRFGSSTGIITNNTSGAVDIRGFVARRA